MDVEDMLEGLVGCGGEVIGDVPMGSVPQWLLVGSPGLLLFFFLFFFDRRA